MILSLILVIAVANGVTPYALWALILTGDIDYSILKLYFKSKKKK